MPNRLESIHIQNYRSLADVKLDLGPVNILFGPSGAGKSSLLDAISFVRDCYDRGVEFASAKRGQGLGLLYDRARPGEPIRFVLRTNRAEYEISLSVFPDGRIDPLPGERFRFLDRGAPFFERRAGKATAKFSELPDIPSIELHEPERLTVGRHFG